MRITAEVSLYPLQDQFLPRIETFIRTIDRAPGLEVTVNQMSTQFRGELEDVTRAVEQALASSFQAGGPQVLVAKFLNADLPIRQAPDLDPPE
jgi:uncharacterized protein YqgV (UPF0045/DUF77 family)